MNLEDLLSKISDYSSKDRAMIILAYEHAKVFHAGVFRRSGEPYITHPVAVACILAEMHADADTIAAGLLHDTIEDTPETKEGIVMAFNPTVAELVDGVTKIKKEDGIPIDQLEAANLRKIVESLTKDVRIFIIKLADRLHNMRTMDYQKPATRIRKSRETIDLYVPFAQYLGEYTFKFELEELAFKYLYENDYQRFIDSLNDIERHDRDNIDLVLLEVSKALDSNEIPFDVKFKMKNIYEVYRKLYIYKDVGNINDIHDLFSIKLILPDVQTCYWLQGRLIEAYRGSILEDKCKDYIKSPKTNKYQGLHISVKLKDGTSFQFQLKTKEMYNINAYGLTAYWNLLRSSNLDTAKDVMQDEVKKMPFYPILDELLKENEDPLEFSRKVKNDILGKNIYVEDKNMQIIELPDGSTPVDFAYYKKPSLGESLISARVNGSYVPLDTKLSSKDIVDVDYNINMQGPRENLIDKCMTEHAKSLIRKRWNIS
ncbi:MAG TPA: HD domain-containing protein [Bacilli bacterium]|nr:HD domain-containing protein [Bacilli bacterium]